MWILTVRSPNEEPREYELNKGKYIIGRQPGNDIVLKDESASRKHAEVDCQDEQVVLRDLGSTNGTFINRVRLTHPYTLSPGDQIRIGQHVISIWEKGTVVEAISIDSFAKTQPRHDPLQLEQDERYAVTLYEVSKCLASSNDLEEALHEVSDILRSSIGADRCEIIPSSLPSQDEEFDFPLAMARQAIKRRRLMIYPESLARIRLFSRAARLPGVKAALCSPIMVEKEITDLICAWKTNPSAHSFNQNDLQLVTAIGNQVAMTVQHTRLLAKAHELEKWAITDSLTDLCNRRQTLNLADLEFQRAQCFQRPFTMLMIDIDFFKKVNDKYGHPIGDQVLRIVAARLKKQLRSVDTLGRYGGDEFVALLVETDAKGARRIADRLRRCINHTPIDSDRGPINASISIGVATLTPETLNATSLLNWADSLMYSAKKAGRNRVRVSL